MLRVLSSSIWVEHNAEIAHRLMNLPGKCQNIHGHSLNISMHLDGELNEQGILAGLDFGTVKKVFREFLDREWDHHVLLNVDDPWAGQWRQMPNGQQVTSYAHYQRLPGLTTTPGDPTTENLAKWLCEWAQQEFAGDPIRGITISIQETGTNGATAMWSREEE